MIWLTEKERVTLAVLGLLAVASLGVKLWIERPKPITIKQGPTPDYAAWDAQLRESRLVNLNRATVEELARLPEIGPVTAQRIVDDRASHGAFAEPADIQRVAGIGPKTFEAIKDYVTVTEQ